MPSDTYRIGVVRRLHSLSVEEKSDALHVLSLAIAESVHELAELGCALDLEEDLVVVVRDLDVEMFLLAIFGLLLHGRAVIRHTGRASQGEFGRVVGDERGFLLESESIKSGRSGVRRTIATLCAGRPFTAKGFEKGRTGVRKRPERAERRRKDEESCAESAAVARDIVWRYVER